MEERGYRRLAICRRTGVGSEIDREVETELELVPDHAFAPLLLEYPDLRAEIADRLGDFDLDPCDVGTVRRIGVQILDASKDERAIEVVNPARSGSGELWRSALVCLVLADTPAELSIWRRRAAAMNQPSLYFVFPPEEIRLNRSRNPRDDRGDEGSQAEKSCDQCV